MTHGIGLHISSTTQFLEMLEIQAKGFGLAMRNEEKPAGAQVVHHIRRLLKAESSPFFLVIDLLIEESERTDREDTSATEARASKRSLERHEFLTSQIPLIANEDNNRLVLLVRCDSIVTWQKLSQAGADRLHLYGPDATPDAVCERLYRHADRHGVFNRSVTIISCYRSDAEELQQKLKNEMKGDNSGGEFPVVVRLINPGRHDLDALPEVEEAQRSTAFIFLIPADWNLPANANDVMISEGLTAHHDLVAWLSWFAGNDRLARRTMVLTRNQNGGRQTALPLCLNFSRVGKKLPYSALDGDTVRLVIEQLRRLLSIRPNPSR